MKALDVASALGITDEFLEIHRPDHVRQLSVAAAGVRQPFKDLAAINDCLHVASQTAMLGGESQIPGLVRTIRDADPSGRDIDPAMIIMVVVLERILRTDNLPVEIVGPLRKRFAEINWFLGEDCVQQLGFDVEEIPGPVTGEAFCFS